MLFLKTKDAYPEWRGEAIGDIKHPLNIEALWSDDELEKVGLFKAAEPPIPDGKLVTGRHAELIDDVLTIVYDLQDKPLAPVDTRFRPLDPWQFWAMVEIAGLAQPISDAFESIPDATVKAVARAKLQHVSKYHRSDPLFSDPYLLSRIGKTSAEIDALWLQANNLA